MAGAKLEEASKVAELAVRLAKEKGRKISMDVVEEALRILKAETSANNEN
jgi:hypothetical protein